MKLQYSSLLLGLLLPISSIQAEISLTPPNAKAGECYAKVIIPAKYKTVEEKVLVKEASNKITIIPPKYEWVEEKVEVSPATEKIVTVPAKYKKVTEVVEVKPALRSWRVSLRKNAAPVSNELLAAAKLKGVDIENTTPGTCYKEYYSPEKYKTVTQEVVIKNETNETKVIPAKYEMVEKTIVVKPATKKTVTVPATYKEVEEKVLVEKEKTVWKKGKNPATKLDGATGEIMCLVKVPAKYKTIKKKVIKTPATTKVIEIPAETKTIKVKKLISPARTETVTIPAVKSTIEKKVIDHGPSFSWIKVGDPVEKGLRYTGHEICLVETPSVKKKITKTVLETPETIKKIPVKPTYKIVKVKKLVEEAKEIKTPIEAVYKTIQKRVKISEAHQSWERILCQTNMNKDVILKIQNALKEKGYNPGKIDGVLGRDTRIALDRYQRDNSLATGGITYETLNALGINQ